MIGVLVASAFLVIGAEAFDPQGGLIQGIAASDDAAKRKAMGEAVRAHFEKVMDELRAADFRYVTAVSLNTYWNPDDAVDPFILGTDYLKQLIDEFHAHGVKVCSIPFEGGDREEVYHRLWELGCDGFSTDYPSVMFKVIRDLKEKGR